MGNIGIWQLLIIVAIIVLLFGTKKLRGLGGDLGSAVKGFKNAMSEEDKEKPKETIVEKKEADQNIEKSPVKEKDQA